MKNKDKELNIIIFSHGGAHNALIRALQHNAIGQLMILVGLIISIFAIQYTSNFWKIATPLIIGSPAIIWFFAIIIGRFIPLMYLQHVRRSSSIKNTFRVLFDSFKGW